MAAIRSRETAPEKALILLLKPLGFAKRRNVRTLPGTPDIAFSHVHVVVFVDGCFWHGCPRCYVAPKINRQYWSAKIARNQRRDRRVARALRARGWSVVRIWACRLAQDPAACVRRIARIVERRSEEDG